MTRPPKRPRPGMPPASVRVVVALRQLAGFGASEALTTRGDGEKVDAFLERLLLGLALYIGCEREDLRLDHEPMLRRRAYDPTVTKVADRYTPHAHDAGCLLYRPQPPEFAGSHHVKTNVRGEHGQYSDVVLAKRERRLERRELLAAVAGTPINAFAAVAGPKRKFTFPVNKSKPKKKWPSRPFPTGRKFDTRRKTP